MSKIEEMLKRLCPEGVERKPLAQAVSVKRGVRVVKQQLAETGDYPVYQNCLTAMGYYAESNCSGDTAFVIAAGAAGSVGYCDVDFWAADDCYYMVAPNEINNKFLYYALKSKEPLLLSKVRKASVPRLARDVVESVEIPLPPRPVQDEIVKALDAMDAAVKALEEERAARQEQFEAMREGIWDWSEKLVPLSEIATEFYRGSGILRTQVTETGVPCVRYGEIYTQYQTSFAECKSHTRLEFVSSPKWVKSGSLIFAITGEKVEEIAPCVAYLGEDRCLAGGDTAVMEHDQNPSYLAYALMTTEAQRQKSRGKVKGKVVHSSIPDLKKVKIPVPERSVQDKIAFGLDAMRTVITAQDEEIAARREQFAGWLEKLMRFDAKEVA